jgi:protein-L-isoaspartate(D-aspartate) O-methyltransferase
MTLEDCRRFYAEEIGYAANVQSLALLTAFARVPRENFLGPGPWRIASSDLGFGVAYANTEDADPRHLYHNVPVALDTTRNLNNGQPGTLARWIDALQLRAAERVFHLGCGVGYFTAIMAEVVGAGGSVIASEVDPALAAAARVNLAGYPNVTVYAGDGAALDPGACDAMLINAGVTHLHPPWLDQLREGGRLVLPLTVAMGATLGKGVVAKIIRERGAFHAQVITFVAIYSCTSVRDPQLEALLGKAIGTGALLKLKSIRRAPHAPEETCLLHADVCLSSAEPVAIQEA